jgi:hypothetical protein
LKAYKDLQAYDGIGPNSNGNNNSTSICFQMLGSRKTMAELDKGGAGQD